jgi:hypothetical protein
MARGAMSIPIQRRPSASAAASVVPAPQNGSRTTSPASEDARMIRSRSLVAPAVQVLDVEP